jgi:cysteinyl-tRNA synthetase
MKLYNTLTRQIDEIAPLNPPEVTVYTCGPTVYDYLHVGNWFTYIREDILIRTLKASGLKPKWVMNITDVGHLVSDADEGEDKLEKGARREGKTAWDVAKFYTEYFEKGLKRLNMLQPDYLPRATDHIKEQIELIQKLEAKGYTYTISDGVYYDTSKFPKYADFAQLDLDEQEAGKRVDFNPEKRNVADFSLWKFSPRDHKRDMEWDSPWGTGFPGWHIECSAMSMKYLGETLDIHAGGIDHVPVHHTNEIAQSEAATGKPFAKYWMHSNHITIEGEKISKSLGNGITLEDIEAKGISLEAFRLHVLESHYRSQSKFSWESLQAAQNRLNHWREAAAMLWQAGTLPRTSSDVSAPEFEEKLAERLMNDLDTVTALQLVDEVADKALQSDVCGACLDLIIDDIHDAFGIDIRIPDISEEQVTLITERERARGDKNWTKSDELRDKLAEQGIGLRDTPSGAIWYRL